MKYLGGLVLLFLFNAHSAQKSEFLQMTLVGYQGWFGTPNDGVFNRWNHWGLPDRVTFELYPDVSEYDESDTFETNLGPLGNGRPSKLFSSTREGVVNKHFQWMQQYGIDGVALQRFANELSSDPKHFRNVVTKLVGDAALKYQRYFYLTFDLSGANPATLVEEIKSDWNNLMANLSPTTNPYYVHQDGKPVIGIWGLGFDDRPANPQQALELIRFFKESGFYIMGGVPWWWREITKWYPVYFNLDVLQPWAVGSYRNLSDLESMQKQVYPMDIQVTQRWGVKYQRVIFPGFAWSNWNGGEKNMIPRQGGHFFWRQALRVKDLGVSAMIAMFDEYDEGTAIAKAAVDKSQVPKNHYFLTLDEDGYKVSSDFYLKLAGEVTRLLKNERAQTALVPVPMK